MKNTITLATFNQTTDAQPLVARLWKSGIRAEIHDESGSSLFSVELQRTR
jgi:hypothetical protein